MRILFAYHFIYDYGGIINWTEHMCHGLKSLGHDVTMMRVEDTHKCSPTTPRRDSNIKIGDSGLGYDQEYGWVWPVGNRFAIKGDISWQKLTALYDLVVWVVPVPSTPNLWLGWQSLYDIKTPQVMVIHDGNMPRLYPHAQEVMGKCRVAAVHPCAYNTIPDVFERHVVPNPQKYREPEEGPRRKKQVLSIQTFKEWKRTEEVVAAVPYINGQVVMAGGGVEKDYMAAGHGRGLKTYGNIWQEALDHGMLYTGYIHEDQRDRILCRSKCLVDASWMKKCAKLGSHINRVVVDAAYMKCVFIGRDLLMDGNPFFDPKDYVTVPWQASSKELGEAVNTVFNMSDKEYERRAGRLREQAVTYFDSVQVAKWLLNPPSYTW